MKLKNIGATVVFGAVILAPVSGFAQSTTSSSPTKQASQQQKVVQRCVAAEKNFTTRSGKLVERIQKREALYDKEDKKVSDLLQKAKDKGVDTSKAQADLDTWKDKTSQLKTARQTLADKLKADSQVDCNSASKGQFKTARQDAKDQLTKIADIQQAKKSFFTGTLKPDLKAVRDQLKQKQ